MPHTLNLKACQATATAAWNLAPVLCLGVIVHSGAVDDKRCVLSSPPPLVPVNTLGNRPNYLIVAGLVLLQLTVPLLYSRLRPEPSRPASFHAAPDAVLCAVTAATGEPGTWALTQPWSAPYQP
ncbi:hypothetical protein HaLaN_21105 [Haematococcus lacustris]|uniref:Uncharacterized protein n=1 Tax=Haematococcus lacustris TaxID=44745 RepID=A0A699ZYR8_HAELA|nr:hypothetical protein HaLaN_21105 [Haematococcus lacustris]